MPEKCKDCCSRLFCMSVTEVNGEDFEKMVNKKDCRKRVFTNADKVRNMNDEELANFMAEKPLCPKPKEECVFYCSKCWSEWLKQPAEG